MADELQGAGAEEQQGMRLLVGIDGREGGRDALALAHALSERVGGSALVVTVLTTGPLPLEFALLPPEEAEQARPRFEEAREALPGLELETQAYDGGSPAGILTMLAETGDFDAIVVGSPHRGPIGRVMVGSVATSLLNGAPADVAVAPAGYAEERHGEPRTIAVAYDGGEEAKRALRRAERLAGPANATIRLLTVVRPAAAVPVMVPGAYSPQFPAHPESLLNEGLKSIDRKIAAETRRLDGTVTTELVRACQEDVDLLVLGSRGYGPLARVLLGSVSRQLVQHAPCPVLVTTRR